MHYESDRSDHSQSKENVPRENFSQENPLGKIALEKYP